MAGLSDWHRPLSFVVLMLDLDLVVSVASFVVVATAELPLAPGAAVRLSSPFFV